MANFKAFSPTAWKAFQDNFPVGTTLVVDILPEATIDKIGQMRACRADGKLYTCVADGSGARWTSPTSTAVVEVSTVEELWQAFDMARNGATVDIKLTAQLTIPNTTSSSSVWPSGTVFKDCTKFVDSTHICYHYIRQSLTSPVARWLVREYTPGTPARPYTLLSVDSQTLTQSQIDSFATSNHIQISTAGNLNATSLTQLLIDSVDSAYPDRDVYDILILDSGSLTATNGVKVSFDTAQILGQGLRLNSDWPGQMWGALIGEFRAFVGNNVTVYDIVCKWGDAIDLLDASTNHGVYLYAHNAQARPTITVETYTSSASESKLTYSDVINAGFALPIGSYLVTVYRNTSSSLTYFIGWVDGTDTFDDSHFSKVAGEGTSLIASGGDLVYNGGDTGANIRVTWIFQPIGDSHCDN